MLHIKLDAQTEIRLIEKGNAPEFLRLIDKNRAYLRQWLGWLDFTRSIPDLERFIDSCAAQFSQKTGFSCLIWSEGRIVGIAHMRDVDAMNKKAMIGYWVGEEFRGRGFARKATAALIDYA